MTCSACGAQNSAGRKFCGECGRALAVPCPSCGAANEPGVKFCGECGSPLEPGAPAGATAARPPGPTAERRLVSVLFADLVGFTALSEARDAEEVRDLLSGYFDTCRRLIERYGGTVEKFIGDAVMAVWGAPVAREDDAERAVRAALDLVAAVGALGEEVGAPDLRARAGVLTGEAAVTVGAEGQGMVAGDMVNTASRVQAAAGPGEVLVGEATWRATEASIAYDEAGTHELKGKAEAVPLWRALRVVAARRGARRVDVLEAPFVGRDTELRLVKDLFHTSAEARKAHMVQVVGIGGIGKSRLSWEFEKYADGLAETVLWHRGRCLAYGDGVAYWALAEMIRMRARLTEEEDPDSALTKLRAVVGEFIPDAEEQRWVEPRLAHLLALEDGPAGDRADLHSAWRLLFERMAARHPTVLVFEDLQWADQSLLEFIDHLLEWSRDHPIYVLALARPDIAERRPNWGTGRRSVTSLYLEPLSPAAVDELLAGLAPGLPEDLRARIRDQAEGVPLYAVETVRMLLDRGVLRREGDRYQVQGAVEELEVPQTLQALIAARLDGLPHEERALVQDAAVLGKAFTLGALASVSERPQTEIEPLLHSLVGKEVVSVQADPRSPERGQYVFLQDLVRRVAYDTLSKRERKARHLRTAGFLESAWTGEEGEITEVVAAHYALAYELAPDAPDAPELRERARDALRRAGERAASLAANEEAQGYFGRAAELADDPLLKAELLERAGEMASLGGRNDQALPLLELATAMYESGGLTHPAARVSARMGEIMWDRGQIAEAVDRMEASFQVLSGDEPDEDLATLAAQIGRLRFFMGQVDAALPQIEAALEIAERVWAPGALSHALNTKALILRAKGRHEEAFALQQHALAVALENDARGAALRAYFNFSFFHSTRDRYEEALEVARDGLALARKFGDRDYDLAHQAALANNLWLIGRWDEALVYLEAIHHAEGTGTMIAVSRSLPGYVRMLTARGLLDEAERATESRREAESSAGVLERADYDAALAIVRLARDDQAAALVAAQAAMDAVTPVAGVSHENMRVVFPVAVEAAFALGDLDRVRTLLHWMEDRPAVDISVHLRAQVARFGARLAAATGAQGAEPGFKSAVAMFRDIGVVFPMAVTLLEYGEWLAGQGRFADAEPVLAEARETFDRLGARPWLERAAATRGAASLEAPAAR